MASTVQATTLTKAPPPNKLVDLIQFDWDHQRKAFVKKQTHKWGVTRAIAYSEKKKLEASGNGQYSTRYRVLEHGLHVTSLVFKPKQKSLTNK